MSFTDFPPHWLLFYFVLAWVLGWVAVRNWGLAAWCGLSGLVVQMLTHSMNDMGWLLWMSSSSWWASGLVLLVGLVLLWGVSRLPSIRTRLLLACLMTPFVLKVALMFCSMAFMIIFRIP